MPTTMQTAAPARRRAAALSLAALALASSPLLFAQAAPAPTDKSKPADKNAEKNATPTVVETEEGVVVMSPFVVEASEDKGYQATSTLAGTRIRTDLKDVGSAISVVTAQFLKDTGATDNQSLLKYTTATEVGGTAGNYAGTGYGGGTDDYGALLRPNSNTRVRGLDSADNTRDFFISEIPWDSYNVGRVDLQRGPNAILFGLGSPAGIINTTTNTASFRESGSVEFRYGKYGALRGTIDYNHVLLPDELALRVDALRKLDHYQEEGTFQNDKRIFGALKYEPKFLAQGSARTSLRANFEAGAINANRPHYMPPNDRITPWFTQMGKLTVHPMWAWNHNDADPLHSNQAQASNRFGVIGVNNSKANGGTFEPWLGGFGNALGGPLVIFNSPTSATQNAVAMVPEISTVFGIRGVAGSDPASQPVGSADGSIEAFAFGRPLGVAGYGGWAYTTGQPGWRLGDYKDKSLTDRTLFDYFTQSLDGPNKKEWNRWESFNVALAQTFFNNRAGFEAVVDRQNYRDGQLIFANQGINIDLNTHLIDGSVNPNVGRAFVQADPNWGNSKNRVFRDNQRITGFGEFRFSDVLDKGWLTRLLGRHVFTGLYSDDKRNAESRDFVRWAYDDGFAELLGKPKLSDNARQPNVVIYLTGDLRSRTSASGLNLVGPQVDMIPTDGLVRFFDSHYKFGFAPAPDAPWVGNWRLPNGSVQAENDANYVGWTNRASRVLSVDRGDDSQLAKSAQKVKDRVTSKALVWQSYLVDDLLVGMIGWRKDTAKSWVKQADRTANDTVNLASPSFVLPETPNNVVTATSKSWSLVAHTPKAIREKLPAGLNFSAFFNKSANFKAEAGRVDVLGNPLGAPKGDTKDFGIVVSALDDRLVLKVNKFETKVQNQSVPFNDTYKIGAIEAWGRTFAGYYRDSYGQDWQWDWSQWPNEFASSAAADAARKAAVTAWFANQPSATFFKAWGINTDPNAYRSGLLSSNAPPGLTATGDTTSKGWEYELTAEPVKGWSISANAAKVDARRVDRGGALAQWIESRKAVYTGPAGDIRLWWAGSTYRVRDMFGEIQAQYNLLVAKKDAQADEIRPWRFNVVTNYYFDHGALKGVNAGAGYRWQDKSIIGYKLAAPATGQSAADVTAYDISQPIHGPTEDAVDLWVGYDRQLSKKLKWHVQLNVGNAFQSTRLVPIATQPTGEYAHYRIAEGMNWTITNRLEF